VTSRERVMTAFAHRAPDRVPAWCGASPAFWDAAKAELGLDDEGLRVRLGDDFRRVGARYAGPDLGLSPGATWKSPFGIERTGIGYGQPLSHPLEHASSVKDILDYPWPDPDWMDVSRVRAEAERHAGRYAILGGDWSPFWHDAIDFMGLDRLYFLMYDQPAPRP
jgi:uroporphyrinogen decarboxylase